MDIVTAFLIVVSGALIGAGVWLVVRDVRQSHIAAPPEADAGSFDWEPAPRAGDPARAVAGERAPRAGPPASPSAPPHVSASQHEAALAESREAAAATHRAPADAADQESLQRYEALVPALTSALRAVNEAFAQAGASLSSAGAPVWEASEACHVLGIVVAARGRTVGRVQVAVSAAEIEISATASDTEGGQVSRLRRLAPAAVNIQSLAEAIAACAWPIASSGGPAGRGR